MKNMFKYYLSNKRRGISLIFVMALTVFSIYFVTSLVQSIFSTVEYSNIACLNDFSFVYPVGGSSFLQNETVEKIKNDDSVENAYPVLLEYTVINNIFGTTSGYAAFMEAADIKEIFNDYSLTVTEGRLPQENSYELIMHEDMLKNKGLSVGVRLMMVNRLKEPIRLQEHFQGIVIWLLEQKASSRRNWKNWDWILKIPHLDCLLHPKRI